MELLTDTAVEQRVVDRVRLKAQTFGQDIHTPSSPTAVAAAAHAASSSSSDEQQPRYKVSPDVLADMYARIVMPLTKDVQVQYLLRRCEVEQSQ
jgi:chorismate mutase